MESPGYFWPPGSFRSLKSSEILKSCYCQILWFKFVSGLNLKYYKPVQFLYSFVSDYGIEYETICAIFFERASRLRKTTQASQVWLFALGCSYRSVWNYSYPIINSCNWTLAWSHFNYQYITNRHMDPDEGGLPGCLCL